MTVPNVAGKTAAQAQQALQAAGLTMQSVGTGLSNAAAQSPAAGAAARRGSAVQVSFAAPQGGRPRVQMR